MPFVSVRILTACAVALIPQVGSVSAGPKIAKDAASIGPSQFAPSPCAEIRTAADFDEIRTHLAGTFCLVRDINMLAVENFRPIGNSSAPFVGELGGRGHVISNLQISTDEGSTGFFGVIDGSGSVRNLRFTNANVTARDYGANAGILAGTVYLSDVTLSDIYANGSVAAPTGTPGGLVGQNQGRIVRAGFTGSVRGGDSLGGLVGYNGQGGMISQSHSAGSVREGSDVGGLAGRNFGVIAESKSSADVSHAASTSGGLVGDNYGAILRSRATGAVAGRGGSAGGLAGTNRGKILRSSAAGPVIGDNLDRGYSGTVGGLVGLNWGSGPPFNWSGSIYRSFATGAVSSNGESSAGGLVGGNRGGEIVQSQASGPVTNGSEGGAGGLTGGNSEGAHVSNSLAMGSVTAGADGGAGGLASSVHSSVVRRSLAVGQVGGKQDSRIGGLVAVNAFGESEVQWSYWDVESTGQVDSDGGRGRTTVRLQAELPRGFDPAVWAITPNVSYPYLDVEGLSFRAPLAATALGTEIFIFLPISQHDRAQYRRRANFAARASKATQYTVIARATGITRDIRELRHAKIDDFWDAATQAAVWWGPLTGHATLGKLRRLEADEPLTARVVARLAADELVLLRASYRNFGEEAVHWMLATSYTVNADGQVNGIIANDPWTGQQVTIDPVTKSVTSPENHPLLDFVVSGFQIVTLGAPEALAANGS